MFCRLKNGKGFVVYSDNAEDETMDLISLDQCDEHGRYDVENITTGNYKYSEVDALDQNRHAISV